MNDLQNIHHLERTLADLDRRPDADTRQQIATLNDLAWALSDIDMQRAFTLGERAYALACAATNGEPPDWAGIAASLRTLGYINQRLGKHQLGLGQLLQALELCEAHALTDILPDALDGIAGIYAQIGDYPTALGYIQRQLAAAQQIDDKRLISNALNNLAALYWQTRERERAAETLQQNLQLAREIGFDRITAITLIKSG